MSFRYYQPFERTTPIQTDEGIKARRKRGDFAKNWWADRWIKALERLGDCFACAGAARSRSWLRCAPGVLLPDQYSPSGDACAGSQAVGATRVSGREFGALAWFGLCRHDGERGGSSR